MRSLKRLGFATRQETDDQGREKEFAFGGRSPADSERAGGGPDRAAASDQGPVLAAVYDTSGREITPEPLATHPLDAARRPRNERKWIVTKDLSTPQDANRDIEITDRIVTLVRELNEAMEAASRNGLLVEPSLAKVRGRYGSIDDDGGHILSIKLFRKLC